MNTSTSMTDNRPLLLLLGGAVAHQGIRCIRQARARGLRVWLTDTADNLERAPEVVVEADRVTPLAYQDPAACVAWASEQSRSEPFVGVFGFREYSVEAVAAVAQALGLPGNPPEAVRRVRNKASCRQALRAHGFRQPASQLCPDLRAAREFAADHPPGLWVVKPPSAMGSQGVSLVQDDAGWERAIANLGDAAGGPFLVECFQHGSEFSAEGMFVYGRPYVLAVTAKSTTGAPHFVELGHTMSTKLGDATARSVEQVVTAALRSLGLTWGIFHVEFWLDDGQPVLGEVHVRPGGDFIHLMIELVTDIELYGSVFDQLLGRPLAPATWQPRRGAAIRYLTPQPGRVIAIQGWDEVAGDPDCRLSELTLHPGDQVKRVRASRDRSGFVLATGETAEAAAQTAARLCSRVSIQTLQENVHDSDR